MTLNQTGQLDQTEAAQDIHSAGWRQGSVFSPNEITVLPFSFDPSSEVLIIVSQSCSVVSPRFDVDPNVEAIVARKISVFREKAPEATGKNQRKLHIKLAQEVTGYVALECDINKRFTFDRMKLLDLELLKLLAIESGEPKKLAAWIARHYTRIALPDELVKKMKIQLLPTLENILKRNSMYSEVDRIFISWDSHQFDQDFFTLGFIFVCNSQDIAFNLDQALLQELDPFLKKSGRDNIYITHLHCGTKSDLFFADVDGYERLSEWDYLTNLGELNQLINET
jgi:hypothetical protein